MKSHLSYLFNSYFYNYKTTPRILREHHVVRDLRKKYIVTKKPSRGNVVVFLDQKRCDNAIQ